MAEDRQDTLRLRTGAVGVYVHDLAEGHRPSLESQGLTLRVSVPRYPTMARYDPEALAHSFAGLLERAVRESSGTDDRAIDVDLRVEGGWAVLSVTGDGERRAECTVRIPLV